MITDVICFSQTIPSTSVDWQSELVQRYGKLHEQTHQLAQKYGWPLRKNYSTNRQVVLQEVDPLGHPIYYTLHNSEAAMGTRTQSLYKGGVLQLALSGNSPILKGRLGMWDGGSVLTTHQEFVGSATDTALIQQKDNTSTLNDHTTHLAGTLIARGINPLAQGMAFGANLSVWDYTDDMSEIAVAAPGLVLSNHAYGPVVGWVNNPSRPGTDPNLKWEWWGNTSVNSTEDYLFGFYTTKARDLDRIAYNNPFYLMVRSADNKRGETGPPAGTAYFLTNTNDKSTLARSRNDAYDVIPAEATAKNLLTIGAATATFNTQNQPTAISSTAFSGWGPTDDGRIKPDLLGMGTSIFSTLSGSASAYGYYTGTSMASANVTGSLLLLQELYSQQRVAAIGSTVSSDPFISGLFMRSSTLRGLVLHTADRNDPAAGPDYRQGWGLLNTEAAARVILNTNQAHLLLQKTLEANGTFTQTVVAQGNEPLIITLCWTDPEGVATTVAPASLNSRTPKLVNDLDVRLTDGTTSLMPFILDPDNPGRSATMGDNSRDNVEQIYIANPTPGKSYVLSVSHKGKMTYSGQPFAVIVSGLHRAVCSFTSTIAPSSDTTICAGSSLLLSTENRSGFTYQWLLNGIAIVNSNAPTYRVTQAGTYAIRQTDASGCSATSRTVQVQVQTVAMDNKLTPAADQWLCQDGQPVQLTVTNVANSQIDWLRNGVVLTSATSSTLSVTEPGSYQVRLTQQGCQSLSDTVQVRATTVSNIPLKPDETNLTLPQGAAVTLYAPTETDYRYQWYQDGKPLANATDYRLSVSSAGTYNVQVTQQNCVGWATDRIVNQSVITSLAPEADSMFTAYPNPVEQTITFNYAYPQAKEVQVSVFDLQGRIRKAPFILKAKNHQVENALNVSDLPAGQYYLRLIDGDRTRTWRFLKK